MKIMSINCQNNKVNKKIGNKNSKLLSDYLRVNKYNLIGTQEMSVNFTNTIKKYLTDYKFCGKYRNNFKIINKIFKKLNEIKENNNIITNYKVLYERNINLPWLPNKIKEWKYGFKRKSIMRRIATSVLIDTEYGKIYMINTHLDYAIEDVQKRQLKKLYKHIYIKNKMYPIIITGDFNLEYKDKIFAEFISKLDNIEIKRIPINSKTNADRHRNKTAIDHIFISNKLRIVDYGIIENDEINNITDHRPIYVEIK